MRHDTASVDQCPVCRDPLFAGYPDRQIALCRSCKCAHHRDCWTYAGQCAQFGCGSTDCVAGKAIFQEDRTEPLESAAVREARPPGMDARLEVETKGTLKAGDPLIYVPRSLLLRLALQGDQMSANGVAGILMGERCSWLGVEYTKVADTLPFLLPRSAASLVTDEAWRLDLEKGEKTVLGWWAIQSRKAMCLEAPELRLHRIYFDRPWMCCLILDPAAQNLGFFGWNGGRIASVGFRLVKDQQQKPRNQESIFRGR